jgi:hypothetical protein
MTENIDAPIFKQGAFNFLRWEFGVSLEFGTWSLELLNAVARPPI